MLLLTISVAMRLWRLDSVPGLNGDEAWYGVQALEWLDGPANDGDSFSWRTPTGNLITPFFFLPQVLVHLYFEPGTATLRATAVTSGILALALNYWLCCQVFDRRTATIAPRQIFVSVQEQADTGGVNRVAHHVIQSVDILR